MGSNFKVGDVIINKEDGYTRTILSIERDAYLVTSAAVTAIKYSIGYIDTTYRLMTKLERALL